MKKSSILIIALLVFSCHKKKELISNNESVSIPFYSNTNKKILFKDDFNTSNPDWIFTVYDQQPNLDTINSSVKLSNSILNFQTSERGNANAEYPLTNILAKCDSIICIDIKFNDFNMYNVIAGENTGGDFMSVNFLDWKMIQEPYINNNSTNIYYEMFNNSSILHIKINFITKKITAFKNTEPVNQNIFEIENSSSTSSSFKIETINFWSDIHGSTKNSSSIDYIEFYTL